MSELAKISNIIISNFLISMRKLKAQRNKVTYAKSKVVKSQVS